MSLEQTAQDLSQLGRPIGETIIIDNSPASYIFHPKNALPTSSWFSDPHGALYVTCSSDQCSHSRTDTELTDMIGILEDLATVYDVREVLDTFV